ncbi:hypothetical protein [Moraxella canis]|uniref:Alpha/beta hydrolase n=1 Tax=Moraxella canis TaxID=90239 RepID=A0A1S9ZRA7_9GAMM|nr:hypothetical protein [Moraxella canis]OOR85571.1 hypothetical protein B0180_01930 [Moraxella canis]
MKYLSKNVSTKTQQSLIALMIGAAVLTACSEPNRTAQQNSSEPSQAINTDSAKGYHVHEVALGDMVVGEMTAPQRGLIVLPSTKADTKYPLVIISHLRAPNCSGGEFAYPCPEGQTELRFDQGMQYLAEHLADSGYAVIVPDYSVVFSGDMVTEPYDQAALWRETIQAFMTHIQQSPQMSSLVDFERVGLFAHSRSGNMLDAAHALFGEKLKGVLTYGPSPDTYDIAEISAAPVDVPYLSILGDLDKDVDQAVNQWIGHWISTPRQTPATVATVPGFGHNYINRALSSAKIDERIGCDVLDCPDANAHEQLVMQTAAQWFDATLKGAKTTLPIKAADALPTTLADHEVSWLAATPKAISTVNFDDFKPFQGSEVTLCRYEDPMNPFQPKDACPRPELGVITTMTYIAQFSQAAADTAVKGAQGLAVHLSPWGSQTKPTNVTITLHADDGQQLALPIAADHPAIKSRLTEFDNGVYQLSTVRLPLPAEWQNHTITHLTITTDGNKIEVRSVDFY